MIDLLELHKYFILKHLRPGDVAVDFTMGNDHDTEFLSKTVGPDGFVYAFDIQEQALASTQEHLVKSGCPDNYQLILDSHSNVKKYVDVPFRAGMFNLGWLPGGHIILMFKILNCKDFQQCICCIYTCFFLGHTCSDCVFTHRAYFDLKSWVM